MTGGPVVSNPEGAFGLTATLGNPRIETLESGESSTKINAGDAVSLNTAGKILQATTTVEPRLVIGVALEDIAAGAVGKVQVGGIAKSVKAQGAINAGDAVVRSVATAGAVAALAFAAVGDSLDAIGVAIAAAAASKVDIYLWRG